MLQWCTSSFGRLFFASTLVCLKPASVFLTLRVRIIASRTALFKRVMPPRSSRLSSN